MPIHLAFFGTPAFAVPALDRLLASSHPIAVVVTQPDRPRGRGQRLAPSPVKAWAETHGIPVLQPEHMRDEAFAAALREHHVDLGIVAAYGKLIPQTLLDLPRLGMINIHASLLPRWRGAAPVHRAVLAGDAETGVTIMRVVKALDAGPMLAHEAVAIGANDTSAELERRLADLGARLVADSVERLARGPVHETPQDERLVTYAARLERRESDIDWARPAPVIHNQIRGLQPWPLAAAMFHGRRIALLRSEAAPANGTGSAPGTIVEVGPEGLTIAAAPGAVRVTQLQMEGKPPMAVRDFLNGHRVVRGDRLDPLPPTP